MARSPYFSVATVTKKDDAKSVLPKLTNQGNLLAGATARTAVGFLLNPISVLKARFEACWSVSLVPPRTNYLQSEHFAYRSLAGSLRSIVRMGPKELMRGFVASSLRDAPYAGLFVLFYELVKQESSKSMFPTFIRDVSEVPSTVSLIPSAYPTGIHIFSAATAGGIATLATHPFDVIKVLKQH